LLEGELTTNSSFHGSGDNRLTCFSFIKSLGKPWAMSRFGPSLQMLGLKKSSLDTIRPESQKMPISHYKMLNVFSDILPPFINIRCFRFMKQMYLDKF
jgi:hypothetical protein